MMAARLPRALPRASALVKPSPFKQSYRPLSSSTARRADGEQKVKGQVIGIDLGTTNSAVALMEVGLLDNIFDSIQLMRIALGPTTTDIGKC